MTTPPHPRSLSWWAILSALWLGVSGVASAERNPYCTEPLETLLQRPEQKMPLDIKSTWGMRGVGIEEWKLIIECFVEVRDAALQRGIE